MHNQNVSKNKDPLSIRSAPKNLNEYVGQEHLVSKGKPIYTMMDNRLIHSMIFYGPPASGKTCLAHLIAEHMNYDFHQSNAVTLNTKTIKEIYDKAELSKQQNSKLLCFIDEIHRLNKPKQDAFLSGLEKGQFVLIGATTENPYFILNPALRSRVFIYQFHPHNTGHIEKMIESAVVKEKNRHGIDIQFSENSKETLFNLTKDIRTALNLLELIVLSKMNQQSSEKEKIIQITTEDIHRFFIRTDNRYSNKEMHYDIISAFIKSVRGSDPDAAVYYLARMLEGGEDPLFIARRLIILSAEDIGLAYPEALTVTNSCYESVEKIGMPEAKLILSETVLFLSSLPKSNSAAEAILKAEQEIKEGKILNVPPHLRDTHYASASNLGSGAGYQYPHHFPNHFIRQKYTEEPVHYYRPGNLGFEKKIRTWLNELYRKGE